MAEYISKNEYLTESEMIVNAKCIFTYLTGFGWSLNAIAAMLGNMESESTINPGIYESLDSSSSTNGFGLVQWTPNTKYKTWADEYGFTDYDDIMGQISRILYELENGLQWIETEAYPFSFEAFSKSTESVETLAQAFLYNYERPASLDQPNRSTQAVKWYNRLKNYTPGDTPASLDQPNRSTQAVKWYNRLKMSKLLFYFGALRR